MNSPLKDPENMRGMSRSSEQNMSSKVVVRVASARVLGLVNAIYQNLVALSLHLLHLLLLVEVLDKTLQIIIVFGWIYPKLPVEKLEEFNF